MDTPPTRTETAPTPRRGWRPNALDVFVLFNVGLLVVMCVLTYYDRWLRIMGPGRTAEFLVYVAVLVAAILLIRKTLPSRPVPPSYLVLVEIGIVAGLAGGYVHSGGQRLYDEFILGIRFDKYVHFWSAFLIGICLLGMTRMRGLRITAYQRMLAFFASLGCLSLWEVGESVIRRRIPENGIGGYSDTMGDLWANFWGGVVFLVIGARVHDWLHPEQEADDADEDAGT